MEITKNQENTSADKKSIGFDYQFLYFIYRALELKPEEKIGYEVKDDVHIELVDGREIFLQLKHSLQTNVDKNIINMTEKDADLWKSLYNWNLSINEIENTRRLQYIKNKEFILVTNKNNSSNNFFIMSGKFRDGLISVEEYKKYLSDLYNSIKGEKDHSKKLKTYIKILIDQNDSILEEFIKRLNFTLGFDDLVDKIKKQIISKHVDGRKVNEIFERCIGILSIWKYENIKSGERVFISFEEIDKKIKHCFIYGRSDKLPRNLTKNIELPDKLEEQNFIKELIEIEDLEFGESIQMAKYTTYRLKLESMLEEWIQENYLTESDKNDFLDEIISIWTTAHKHWHIKSNRAIKKKNLDDDDLQELCIENALECLYELRNKTLEIKGENLNTNESNGAFYHLSEKEELGWNLKWERIYKK
ncbi:hypothetical protein ACV3R5_05740 [Clostridium perfringens]